MLITKVKDGENIDRALKRYRRKYKNTKVLQELRKRKEFKKPSIKKREQLIKAQYKELLYLEENK
ncbi:30S ribosomal protein S21 [Lutibacter sp. TH_r2]|uniref:30S ribosomal protein S21 n=1 Tax=Lutibacter sp. TH_r2 TaxID=3082083 RepID=UPI0029549209|nr:30S ribosomal protein S21 [Lutibacter sp. TH_r2]MDV7188030.1 30S ribosomal protein S21 [Lutibacter sp. TH_r2]